MKNLIFLFLTLVITSCHSTYDKDNVPKFGPKVDCDSKDNAEEVALCIQNQYKSWNKYNINKTFLWDAGPEWVDMKNLKSPNPPLSIATYKLVDNFSSIKSCYSIDKCHTSPNSNNKYDNYEGADIWIKFGSGHKGYSYNWNTQYSHLQIGLNHKDTTIKGKTIYISDNPTDYRYSHVNPNRDVIVFKENNQIKIMYLIREITEINDNRSLATFHLVKLCPANSISEFNKFTKSTISVLKNCGGYKFYKLEKNVSNTSLIDLSLDKRINPTKAYIRYDNQTFEVDIR